MGFLNFFSNVPAAAAPVPEAKVDKTYKRLRIQTFLAATFGYALYYVCRLSMGVMKQPLIDAGLLLDGHMKEVGGVMVHDYTYVSWFWIGAAVISFLLPILNWRRKRPENV